ncbi:MerR family transcriptional regulator [Komagataeibacter saccharivorans]|uniref:MerR family transcriptional regulator n=1 Tax=Komagataeibacter saccharivorans TaxID=265959 RepID=UPI0024A86C8B|nr:MerR family transcriptional regulator [Komagataeibacter saccharivorans]
MNADDDPQVPDAAHQDVAGIMDGLPIYDVARELGLAQHVMRMWESRFPQLNPLRGQGGRRYYRPQDIAVLREIADLLYVRKLSIAEAQDVLAGAAPGAEEAALDAPQAAAASDKGFSEQAVSLAPENVDTPAPSVEPAYIESVAVADQETVVEEVVVEETVTYVSAQPDADAADDTIAAGKDAAPAAQGEESAEAEIPLEQIVMIELERMQAENTMLRESLRGVLVELQALRAMVPA